MSKVTVNESIVVDASPDKTWALVGDFAGLVDWFPIVTKSTVEGSGVGALRYLTMPDGNQLTERQETRDDAARCYEYAAIAGALPFTDYRSKLSVSAADDGAKITWSAQFVPLPDAPVDAVAFISSAYRSGLDSAKKRLERAP